MNAAKGKKPTRTAPPTHTPSLRLYDATVSELRSMGRSALFLPVDIASLVFFRIAFGLILLWEVVRYIDNGFIESYWLEPRFLFSYWPFDFLAPLPGAGMYLLYYFLGLLACCITVGLFYRVSTLLFFLGMSYSFLLDQARYLNHQYLICLVSFVLIFLPANRAFALDTNLFKDRRSDVVPAWPVWLLRFTVGLPYFFGGVAKINPDWLRGEPLRTWLAFDTDFPLIGPYFTEDWMIYIMSYSGLLFDLLIIPALLFRRTRAWAFVFMILFNLMNARLFEIGIFPWFMIGATLIFFHPAWPGKLRAAWNPSRVPTPLREGGWDRSCHTNAKRKWILAGLGIWAVIHVVLPLRHLAIPGNVHWTEEGHKYAWHMKLRTKRAKAELIAIDKRTGELIPVRLKDFLSSEQRRKVPGNPDMLWQLARLIKSDFTQKGRVVSVHADAQVSLNSRIYQPLVSPETDLSTVRRPVIGHADWILPLRAPLSARLASPGE